jgi:hypothetical protein
MSVGSCCSCGSVRALSLAGCLRSGGNRSGSNRRLLCKYDAGRDAVGLNEKGNANTTTGVGQMIPASNYNSFSHVDRLPFPWSRGVAGGGGYRRASHFISFARRVFPVAPTQASRRLNEDCLPTEVALCCMSCMCASYYAENNQNCQQNARKNQSVHRLVAREKLIQNLRPDQN